MTNKGRLTANRAAAMRNAIKAAIFALALALATPVAAQDYIAGLEAYESGDYAAALREFRPLADQGHAEAQAMLGIMYFEGWGVPKDDAEAVKWYRKAAEQGHARAQTNLGYMYEEGLGVAQDYAQAHMWWSLSARQGDRDAARARNFVEGEMTREQFAEAQKLAREWKPK